MGCGVPFWLWVWVELLSPHPNDQLDLVAAMFLVGEGMRLLWAGVVFPAGLSSIYL